MTEKKPTYDELERRVRELEAALKEGGGAERVSPQERFLRMAIHASPSAVYIFDVTENRNVWENETHRRLFGADFSEKMLSRETDYLTEIIHPDDVQVLADRLEALRRAGSGEWLDAEYRVGMPGGGWRWFHDRAAPLERGGDGELETVIGAVIEVSGRKEAEAALLESEERYRMLFEAATDAIFVADADSGIILDCNHAAGVLTGRSREELTGMHQTELHPPEFAGKSRKDFGDAVRERGRRFQEMYIMRAGGERVPVEISSGGSVHVGDTRIHIGLFRDISARKRTEAARRESEEKYRALFESAGDAIFLLRGEYFIDCNNEAVRLFGAKDRAEIVGRHLTVLHPAVQPDGRPTHESARGWRDMAFRTGLRRFPWRCRRLDGGMIETRVSLTPLVPDGGDLFIAIVRDETEERRAAETLAKARSDLVRAQEIGNIGSWEWDVPAERLTWSDQLYRIFGVTHDFPLTYDAIHAMIHPDDRDLNDRTVGALMAGRDGADFFFRIVRPGGEVRHLHQRVAVERSADGAAARLFGVIRDVTGLREQEERLREALAEKDVLLRELYHRTKNNMQLICAMLGLKAADSGEPGVARIFREMEDRIVAMSLVHQKLYQTGSLTAIDMADYLHDLVSLIVRSWDEGPGGISARFRLESVPADIDTAIPCGLIVNELVYNAVRHAFPGRSRGTISVSLAPLKSGPVVLTVSDDGAGVPEGFDYRSDCNFGLRMVANLAEMQLGGRLSLRRKKRGVTWTIRFPEGFGGEGGRR